MLNFAEDLNPDFDADDPQILLAQRMSAAGNHMCLIYGYLNTGLIVSETNVTSLSEEDLVLWQVALEDYEEECGEPAPQQMFDADDLTALRSLFGPGDLWKRRN